MSPVTYKSTGTPAPTCIATVSLGFGQPHLKLPAKLRAAADAGFDSVELAMPDLVAYATDASVRGASAAAAPPDPDRDFDVLVSAAREVRALAASLRVAREKAEEGECEGLRIAMLQPFAHFEGWPRGSAPQADALRRAEGWLRLCGALGAEMMQIGASDRDGIADATTEDLVEDLAAVADMAAKVEVEGREGGLNVKIAYENWCWATKCPGWREVWEVVRRADRPNLGLCLDTFQSAGDEWADPTTASGRLEKHDNETVERRWRQSLADLTREVPADKIYILQISDAYRMTPPLGPGVEDGRRPGMRWALGGRPLPGEEGGYLPVADFLGAVMDTGFRGYLSMEVFDARVGEKFGDDMLVYGRRAMRSLQELMVD